jgi:hypothetical protein
MTVGRRIRRGLDDIDRRSPSSHSDRSCRYTLHRSTRHRRRYSNDIVHWLNRGCHWPSRAHTVGSCHKKIPRRTAETRCSGSGNCETHHRRTEHTAPGCRWAWRRTPLLGREGRTIRIRLRMPHHNRGPPRTTKSCIERLHHTLFPRKAVRRIDSWRTLHSVDTPRSGLRLRHMPTPRAPFRKTHHGSIRHTWSAHTRPGHRLVACHTEKGTHPHNIEGRLGTRPTRTQRFGPRSGRHIRRPSRRRPTRTQASSALTLNVPWRRASRKGFSSN